MRKVLEFMLGVLFIGFIMWLLVKISPLLGALAVIVWLIWAISEYEGVWTVFIGLGIPSIFGMIFIVLGLIYGS